MKKILLILLLFVIPFQFSWAAAAVYCQHEAGSSSHFGHHSHQHKVQDQDQNKAKDSKTDAAKSLEKYHGDCESCHLFSHASLISAFAEPARLDAQGHLQPRPRSYRSHIPAPPKRPDWLLVA
jgi:hypothetical protein